MNYDHDCPGILDCRDHPRPRVIKALGGQFAVWGAGTAGGGDRYGLTFPEAIAYATSQARAEKLAAIQDGAA